ncbi:MAG TPA: tripartite tricarboxylate transporter substrate-binding protein [Xanthobacteraceae bacterium]|jgi:tripartite-type tricarboxylate transporter receptor subunit TctC|nr:tripartite tricarboxylate transporter substrate-binding protein [Xanthobacteraceae bacterium]
MNFMRNNPDRATHGLRFASPCSVMSAALLALGLSVPIALSGAARANDFYAGKVISIYIGTGEGPGALSAYPRAIAQVIGKYIPGNPAIVVRNMPGAGGIKAANFIYGIAPQDGTAWGFITRGFVRAPMLATPQAQFDPTRYHWIGTTSQETSVAAVWTSATGVRSLPDAMTQEVVFGGTSLATDTGLFPSILNRLIGTRFKVIVGYKSSTDVDLAMERGEVQGKIWTWGSLKSGNTAGWVEDKKVSLLAQFGLQKARDLPDLPLALDYAKTPEDRQVMELIFAPLTLGYPSFTGPGVPPERVEIMRRAFDKTMRDPEFIDLMKQQNLALDPATGEAVQVIVQRLYQMPQSVIERARMYIPPS